MPLTHWALQILPPLSLFGVFFATRSGTALVYLFGLLLLPALWSLISILAKLIRFRARRVYLVRPLLTLLVFACLFALAEWTWQQARSEAVLAAVVIQQQCQRASSCPAVPEGWDADGAAARRSDLGIWTQYLAIYRAEGDQFSIRVYRGPDTGEVIRGGRDESVVARPYTDD